MLVWIVVCGSSVLATPVGKRVIRPAEQQAVTFGSNGELDQVDGRHFVGWNGYGTGYEVDRSVRHAGGASARCSSLSPQDRYGIAQSVDFGTGKLAPILVGGWSRARDVSGTPDSNYSVWYNRDRSLFKKYLPVIKQVAEAGWEPITLATSSDPDVWIERFGVAPATGLFFTVMNTAEKPRSATIHCDELSESGIRLIEELDRTAQPVVPPWTLQLQPGEVRVFQAVAAESRRD